MTIEAIIALTFLWGFGGILFASIVGTDPKIRRGAEEILIHAIVWPITLIDMAVDKLFRRLAERRKGPR